MESLAIQPNVYYTLEEAAELLRVSPRSVRQLLAERKLGLRIGRHWRVLGATLLNLSASDAMVEAKEVADWLAASRSSLQELWDNESDAVYDRL